MRSPRIRRLLLPTLALLALVVVLRSHATFGGGGEPARCFVPDNTPMTCGTPCDPYSVVVPSWGGGESTGLDGLCPIFLDPCSHCCSGGACDGYNGHVPCGESCRKDY
jgi:hypothetical protein